MLEMPGFCDKHKKAVRKEQDERRGTAAERGYDSKWAKARVFYLKKHPLCVYCQREHRTVLARVVDHIKPHKLKAAIDSGDAARIAAATALFWDSERNWQSLCFNCHDSVKRREELAASRAAVQRS